jgi:hypothetical protein
MAPSSKPAGGSRLCLPIMSSGRDDIICGFGDGGIVRFQNIIGERRV